MDLDPILNVKKADDSPREIPPPAKTSTWPSANWHGLVSAAAKLGILNLDYRPSWLVPAVTQFHPQLTLTAT